MAWRRDSSSPGAVPLAQVDAQLHAARTLWLATSSPQGSPRRARLVPLGQRQTDVQHRQHLTDGRKHSPILLQPCTLATVTT